jgi:hypothetical protein
MKIRFFLALFFLILSQTHCFASSSYVLPYPGYMPGNKLYILDHGFDKIQNVLSFGSISQFKRSLALSDKNLVEAKTLFEYGQYKLAINALRESDLHYIKIYPLLKKAQKKGVDISEKEKLLKEASAKHKEILLELRTKVPSEFMWEDEESTPLKLEIHKKIIKSITLRS